METLMESSIAVDLNSIHIKDHKILEEYSYNRKPSV